jgi:glycosyltransferase involved in cell wall biosynthesis
MQSSMKILIVHNSYQLPGGEDVVCARERDLLRAHGHRVEEYQRSNHELDQYSWLQRLQMAGKVVWNGDSKRDFEVRLREFRPDVVHVHNTFMVISPSIYSACREFGVPVVQTLHNYRLLCPSAVFFRNGKPCHDCESHLAHSVLHGCYRESRTATASVALMLSWHRAAGTYHEEVDRYIALTQFSRSNFLRAGFAAERIMVKPNFVDPDPGERRTDGAYALYVGRISPEKGLRTVMSAWRKLSETIPLRLAGTGPLVDEVRAEAEAIGPHIEYLGQISGTRVLEEMKGARFVIFPSELYENFPLTLCEAFACGVPVLASNIGAMQEIVANDETGIHFQAGNADDLAGKVLRAWTERDEMRRMGKRARIEFEDKYTAELNYSRLMEIYQSVLSEDTRVRLAFKAGQEMCTQTVNA